MTRPTFTAAEVRARDLRDHDVILVASGDDNMFMWREVMDVWRDEDLSIAEDHYRGSHGWSDEEKIEFLRSYLSGGLASYVVVRYHVETPHTAQTESDLAFFRACDLVTVQQPQNPAPAPPPATARPWRRLWRVLSGS